MSRPPTFATPEEFGAAADAFFTNCEDKDIVPTVNGLALALGFNSRQSLLNYAEKPEFMDVVKGARTRLELAWETRLAGTACTGAIFWLKNQGWKDKQEQEISGPNGGPVQTVSRIERVVYDPANPDS